MNRAELKELLSQDYHYDHWLKIYEYLFSEVEFFNEPSAIEHNETEKIEQFRQIGFVTLKDDSKIALFEVKVASGIQIPRNRVYLNNVISRWIAGGGFYEAAIGIFYAEGQPDYRFTFAMRGAKFTEDMKVEEVKTNPKRYTYVLGKNEKCETAARRFEELSKNGAALTLSNVEDAFSVEKLNKEFFSKVSDSFYKLVGGTVEKKSFDHVLRLPGIDYEVDKKNGQKHQKFAVRLIGRIVFCWFLKFKKSEEGKALIPEDLLSTKAIKNSSNYYHDILEKLFFECLNTPDEQRRPSILPSAKDIPFLNGGLFEPQSNGDYYELQELAGYYQSRYYATLTIPNDWFMTFFETLEQYNFTIDENSIFDVDVSVDPEMLGRIFENLLAEINPETGETARKSTGSYYTPREIVDYMVDQSLIECLKNKTGLDAERLQRLFSYQEQILDDKVKFSDVEKRKISNALHQIKALDPACGSGAFPMGILHKMLYALSQVDPDSQMWYQQQIAGVTDYKLKENLLAKFEEENVPYIHKLGIINHCVYGVDIQPIAIEISKLRFFLSLVVDEKINDLAPNRGVKPLPNLDFKFVAANTLIPAPGNHGKSKPKDTLNLGDKKEEVELGFADIDPFFLKFDELTEKYFYADNKGSKISIRAKLEAIVNEKVDEKQREIDALVTGVSASKHAEREVLRQRHKEKFENLLSERQLWESYLNIFKGESVGFFDYRYFFPDVKDGFDIVIGNPPYKILTKNNTDTLVLKSYLSTYKTIKTANSKNIYIPFIENAINALVNSKGLLTFIVPEGLFTTRSYSSCVELMKNEGSVPFITTISGCVFENAVTGNLIFLFSKFAEIETKKFYFDENFNFFPLVQSKNLIIEKINFTKTTQLGQIASLFKGMVVSDRKNVVGDDKSYGRNIFLLGKSIGRWNIIKEFYTDYDSLNIVGGTKRKSKHDTVPRILIRRTGDKLCSAFITKPALTESTLYSCWSISTDFDNYFLLGLLNSKLLTYFIRYSMITNTQAFPQILMTDLEMLPIANATIENQKLFSNVVNYILKLGDFGERNPINEYVPNSHIVQLFEEVLDAMVYELYFEGDFKKADIAFMKYAKRDFKSIEGLKKDEKIEIIHSVYQKLREKNNEIRQNLKLIDTRLSELIMPIKTTN